jgi:hypothetical protein
MIKISKSKFLVKALVVSAIALSTTSCSAAIDAKASNNVLETCFTALEEAAAASSAEVNALPLSTLEPIMQNCLEDESLWGGSVLECTKRSSDNDVHCSSRYGSSSIKLESNISEQLRTKYGASN